MKTDAIWWRVKRPSIHVSLMTRLHESCVTSISEVQITHVAEMKPHQSMALTTMTRTIDPRMYTHTDGFPISPRTSGPLLEVIRKQPCAHLMLLWTWSRTSTASKTLMTSKRLTECQTTARMQPAVTKCNCIVTSRRNYLLYVASITSNHSQSPEPLINGVNTIDLAYYIGTFLNHSSGNFLCSLRCIEINERPFFFAKTWSIYGLLFPMTHYYYTKYK